MSTNPNTPENQADLEALRKAREEDDGTRIPLSEFLTETDKDDE